MRERGTGRMVPCPSVVGPAAERQDPLSGFPDDADSPAAVSVPVEPVDEPELPPAPERLPSVSSMGGSPGRVSLVSSGQLPDDDDELASDESRPNVRDGLEPPPTSPEVVPLAPVPVVEPGGVEPTPVDDDEVPEPVEPKLDPDPDVPGEAPPLP